MPAAKRQSKLELTDETWGERLHRAYRRSRQQYGHKYADHAIAISELLPTSDQFLMRLEDDDELPTRPSRRQRIYLALLAYGFTPEEWDLTPENCGLTHFDMKKVRATLDPAKRKPGVRRNTNKEVKGEAASKRCTTTHSAGIPQRRAA